jgi:DNA-binding MurR/RpiR family transcriptional regulator
MRRSLPAAIEIREVVLTGEEAQPISEQVRHNIGAYTAAEHRVAQALLEDYPVAGLETVARFA